MHASLLPRRATATTSNFKYHHHGFSECEEGGVRMAGAIIENMSTRKLAILGAVLLVLQVLCFMVGAIFAPNPNNSDQFLATWCKVGRRGWRSRNKLNIWI